MTRKLSAFFMAVMASAGVLALEPLTPGMKSAEEFQAALLAYFSRYPDMPLESLEHIGDQNYRATNARCYVIVSVERGQSTLGPGAPPEVVGTITRTTCD